MALQVSNQVRRQQAAARIRAMIAQIPSDQKVVSGRSHIRGDLATGNLSKRVGLWDINTKPGTALDKVKAVYFGALNAADDSEAFAKEANESGRFTPEGVKAALLEHGASTLAVLLKRNKQTLDRARRELAETKAKLGPPAPDPADAAGAIRRWEFRNWFRGLSDRERSRYMLENRDKMNPEEAQALMEVPASRTGIMEMDRNDLIDRAIRAAHGDSAIEDVQALEKGIELAAAANEAAREQIAEDGGATVAQFDEAAAPFEARASVPWLRKEKDKVYAMDVARKSWAPATDEQVSAGDYFPTWDQFNQANGREAGARFE